MTGVLASAEEVEEVVFRRRFRDSGDHETNSPTTLGVLPLVDPNGDAHSSIIVFCSFPWLRMSRFFSATAILPSTWRRCRSMAAALCATESVAPGSRLNR